MTNPIPALVLITLIQPPHTNYLGLSGKEIEVGGTVIEKHEFTYTNHYGVPIVRTHWETNVLPTQKFILQEKWVPAPFTTPPLPQHR